MATAYIGRRRPLPDYGPGSVNRAAKAHLEAIAKVAADSKGSRKEETSHASRAIADRIAQEKAAAADAGRVRRRKGS